MGCSSDETLYDTAMLHLRRDFLFMAAGAAAMTGMTGVATVYTGVRGSSTMVTLGDSITRGVSYTDAGGDLGGFRASLAVLLLADAYSARFLGSESNGPAYASAHEGWNAYGIGFTGQAPADIYTKGIAAMAAYTPGLLLLMAGTNDLLQPWTTAPIRASMTTRLGTLLDALHAVSPSTCIIISTLPPISNGLYALVGANDTERTSYNTAISSIAQAREAFCLRIDPASSMTLVDHISDGVHPNAAGYAIIASHFEAAIQQRVQPLANVGQAMGLRGLASAAGMTGRVSISQMIGRATARSG